MLIRNDNLEKGRNEIVSRKGRTANMLMDVDFFILKKGEELNFFSTEDETAISLYDGKIQLDYSESSAATETKHEVAERTSLLDECPTVLHFSKSKEVKVIALEDSEFLVQKTKNDKEFETVLYKSTDIKSDIFGNNVWGNTAQRVVRTVFDYNTAPYSNMVLGEVINPPGKWSGIVSHWHEQPEVYFYKFDRPQGFGAGFIGDDVYKLVHNSALCIPGGPTHPSCSSPGYAMHYTWMIRHLDGKPWTERIMDPEHTWLLEDNPQIWEPK
ncbi:MAG: 5-deoxy-glucuronate isomerase [Anaerovoracaceae bacterium]